VKVRTVGLDPCRAPRHFWRNGDADPVLSHPAAV
jgi:hypothetical protein